MQTPVAIRRPSRHLALASLLSLVAFISGCTGRSAARDAVAQYHSLYNAGKYYEIYQMYDKTVTTDPSTEDNVLQSLDFFRGTLGNVQSSELTDFYQHELFVDEPHLKLTYRTKFDNDTGTEIFFFHFVNGHALLINYICNSPELDKRLKEMNRPR